MRAEDYFGKLDKGPRKVKNYRVITQAMVIILGGRKPSQFETTADGENETSPGFALDGIEEGSRPR